MLFTEVYDNEGASPHKVDITTTVTSDTGKVVFKDETERASSELQGARGGYGHTERIPLHDLGPGRLRAEGRGAVAPRQGRHGEPGSAVLGRLRPAGRSGSADRGSRESRDTACCLLLMTMTMLWQGSAAPGAPMRRLEKGSNSVIDDARQVTARTADEWAALWRQHAPDRPRPTVDFSKEMVVGVFMGSRPTAGFAVEIVGVNETPGGVVVRYRETRPSRDAMTAQVLTSPYDLVAVPTIAGTVTFEKVEK